MLSNIDYLFLESCIRWQSRANFPMLDSGADDEAQGWGQVAELDL